MTVAESSFTGGSAALSPDGHLLAYRPHEKSDEPDAPSNRAKVGEVRIIEIDTGNLIAELDAPCNAIHDGVRTVPTERCSGRDDHPEHTRRWDMGFSPDGRMLWMVDGADSALTIWDVETGRIEVFERVPGFAANMVEFSPDVSTALALFTPLGGNGLLQIHDLNSGTSTQRELDGSSGGWTYTPDQSIVISADFGGGLHFHEGFDLGLVESISAHEGQIFDLDLSPNGTLVATAGDDGVRVWSVEDRALESDLGFDGDNVRWVRFLDDSRLLLVPSLTSEAIVVTLDPTDLADVGFARVTRSFTSAECQTYRIDPCPTLEEIRSR